MSLDAADIVLSFNICFVSYRKKKIIFSYMTSRSK